MKPKAILFSMITDSAKSKIPEWKEYEKIKRDFDHEYYTFADLKSCPAYADRITWPGPVP